MLTFIELDPATAARAFGSAYFNLIRRGADGSLTLSQDHWRLSDEGARADAFRFVARDEAAPELVVDFADVKRIVWDRLPRQRIRSQIRFHFANADVWTFSGAVDLAAIEG
ncbi:MAG: hypothetical protein JOZ81_33770 [Chloroflexi bacterium]|nr:hypothetical protein [Chloroflexota bacterium]MBV9544389.1 hypothetical protein [Chloroflexota bacterium]